MTAIDWVIQYLNNVKPNQFCSIETIKEILEQAKVMEKQQIIKARLSLDQSIHFENALDNAEQYFEETFNKSK